ncbi:phage major capsid protein [uncultured Methanobrevibacter sp.]|uniref:phage major capsid protein n=1 Tax=uncultured Methanobrevibacter sp. TaxID=253161 RepID=UPI00261B5CC3|nr:phage major capsid protein [uncultured Methanobrevibacter sp.]
MKDYLKKLIESKSKKINEIRSKIQASQDVNEVRSLTAEAEELQTEIKEAEAKLNEIETEEARSAVPAEAKLVNPMVKGSFKAEEKRDAENVLESMEYRNAFKAYVQNGTKLPSEIRGQVISTDETGAAIPLTIMNEVINTVRKRYGNLYNKVRKMNVKGGVDFPIGALQASFKWINESTVSPRQKTDKLGKVSFSYYTAEIRIAQSFVSSIVTIDDFETKIAEVIAVAYLQAMDQGIVNGTGDGQMTGILNDARVTNVVEMTASDINSWKAWRTKFFSKLPLGYRAGEFIFPLSTVETYLETMSDANNNPVFRQATGLEVNDGDAVNPNGRFFGRDISLVEPDILPDFDSANAGDVIGIFWQPEEYAINENFGFTMRRYFDEETNEWVNKAIVVVDGKVLNPNGYYLIKKKASN